MSARWRNITLISNGARGRAFIGVQVRSITKRELYPARENAAGGTIWESEMRTTFTIEIKMDVADDEQMKLMHEILKTAAQTLFAQTVLLSGKRPPMIALKSENSFTGQADIELHSPSE